MYRRIELKPTPLTLSVTIDIMDKNLSNYFFLENVSLRTVADRDVDRLVEIINDAYSYQDAVKGESRTNPDHLRKRISETDFYTVLKGDEIIGCIYLEPEELVLHFGLLTLAPDFRGKGIAEAIMSAIDKYADDHNFTTLDLDYMSLAPWLKKYYEKYGFAETGEVAPWGKIDLIRMQKSINKEKTMKTILVDGISGLILKDGTLFQEMYDLLEQYPNPKLVLTGANDEQWKEFNLDISPYEVFTLKHNPEKTDAKYYGILLNRYGLKADDVIFFEHNSEAARTAESVGIKTYFYDHTKKDLVGLKNFIDRSLS